MKKLHEIIKEKSEALNDLKILRDGFVKNEKLLLSKIKELKRLEKLGTLTDVKIDLDKIQIAENILRIGGNPTGKNLHLRAIEKIANNPEYLQRNYIGNKSYEAFYQECNCEYGYGPRHGSIVDRIEISTNARKNGMTDDEKDACIYYLTNIEKIKKLSDEVSS